MIYDDRFLKSTVLEPLTYEEMIEYLKRVKFDKKAREKLILHNIRLVLNRAHKFSNIYSDESDLISIGLVGLIKSIDTFDINRNIKFSTYSVKCIDNEILMYIRKKSRNINNIDYNFATHIDSSLEKVEKADTFIDNECNIELDIETKEVYLILRNKIKNLSERDKKVILLYYGFIDNKCYTQKQIGEILSISRPSVSRIITKTLKELRIELENEEIIEIKNKK